MASKVFTGTVSIVLNTKGEVALKADPDGKFSAADAAGLYTTMAELAKARKASVNKYSLFLVKGGTVPVLLANRYGNPYVALLAPQGDGKTTRKGVTKLA